MIFKFARSHLITVISGESGKIRLDSSWDLWDQLHATQLEWPKRAEQNEQAADRAKAKSQNSYELRFNRPSSRCHLRCYIVYSIQPTTRPHRDKPSATSPLARCHRLGYSQPHRHRAGQANCHTQPHYTTSSPFTLPGGLDEVYLRYESGTWQASRRMRVHAPAKASHARSSGKTLNTRALRSPGGA